MVNKLHRVARGVVDGEREALREGEEERMVVGGVEDWLGTAREARADIVADIIVLRGVCSVKPICDELSVG